MLKQSQGDICFEYLIEIQPYVGMSSWVYRVLRYDWMSQPIREEDELGSNHDFPRVEYRTWQQVMLLSGGPKTAVIQLSMDTTCSTLFHWADLQPVKGLTTTPSFFIFLFFYPLSDVGAVTPSSLKWASDCEILSPPPQFEETPDTSHWITLSCLIWSHRAWVGKLWQWIWPLCVTLCKR